MTTDSKVLIIAEAGVNHNGSFELACRLADAAKNAGADVVKFQTGVPEKIISTYARQAEYQRANTGRDESQLDMVRRIMLPPEAFPPLRDYCRSIGIKFLSTPFDLESIDTLRPLEMDAVKVPSGEITNLPYLRKIATMGLPVIMSTGMCRMGEVDDALQVLESCGVPHQDITLLHCNTEYPTPYEDVNLRAMPALKAAFGCPVGFSDHTRGIEVPIAAVALGATVIEKHFTLDRNMPGPDHKASLQPDELAQMVLSIRHIEVALGTGRKCVSASEQRNIAIARKSLVATRHISRGEPFTPENITAKRPGNGISPMLYDMVIGMPAPHDFDYDQQIELK